MALLQWIESTPFSVWLRESPSVWAYPTMMFVHTVGLSFSVGPSVAIDLRLLGFARRVPIAPLESFVRVIWLGFWINAASGVLLLAANATTKLANPLFYVKMTLVFAAMTVTAALHRRVFRGAALAVMPVAGVGKILAIASIVCWFGAIAAGRFMTYAGATP